MSFLTPAAATLLLAATLGWNRHEPRTHTVEPRSSFTAPAPKIQAAILLDVSNSMDGLIEQAKAQLWNMVSVMGRAKCNGQTPQIEIALYEYGRTNNDAGKGFVKQIMPFTNDLDEVSKKLFSLNTNGGDEYCGQVIFTSLDELKWDTASSSYKVIFISGNEDFLQGKLHYTKACSAAKDKGVIVNTIYCGNRQQGIAEHWNLGAECGQGSFTNINPDARVEDIPTPYDSTLMVLNDRLNGTYIGYGMMGSANVARQAQMDKANSTLGYAAMSKRVAVKGKKELYRNDSWDLVDAQARDTSFAYKVKKEDLPEVLQNRPRSEVARVINEKSAERARIQAEIEQVNVQRNNFLTEARKRNAAAGNTPTLESEVEKIIREQAKRYSMVIGNE